jgi:hydrogenase nickel incorporation protein HypA/HybF
MHERSLAKAILAQAREAAGPYENMELQSAVVALGPLSGVEPLLLESAFREVAQEEGRGEVRIAIEQAPLLITCDSCNGVTEVVSFQFRCGLCGGVHVRVTSGEAVILKNIELADSDAPR